MHRRPFVLHNFLAWNNDAKWTSIHISNHSRWKKTYYSTNGKCKIWTTTTCGLFFFIFVLRRKNCCIASTAYFLLSIRMLIIDEIKQWALFTFRLLATNSLKCWPRIKEEMPLDQRKDKRASPHKPNVNKAHYKQLNVYMEIFISKWCSLWRRFSSNDKVTDVQIRQLIQRKRKERLTIPCIHWYLLYPFVFHPYEKQRTNFIQYIMEKMDLLSKLQNSSEQRVDFFSFNLFWMNEQWWIPFHNYFQRIFDSINWTRYSFVR